MKEKIIITDADGVLVDWNGAFDMFMEIKGHPRLPDSDNEYSIAKRHSISDTEAMVLVKEFNEGRYIAELNPFADSIKNIKILSDLGFRFIVVTSLSDHPDAKIYRTYNLKTLFGDIFDEINCIKMGESKAAILQKWAGSGYFWIEDHMRQAEAGHEAGLKPVLIEHPYNIHYTTDLFPKVSFDTPWTEIVDMVKQEYNLTV